MPVRARICAATAPCAFAALVLLTSCRAPPPEQPAVDPAEKYARLLIDFPFGGRPVRWWRDRLAELSPGGAHPDAALYRMTVERAAKNGLAVDEATNRVRPGQEVTVQILVRLGVLQ
ncbi:MAG: hypothetical protein A2138_12660 [Deltaproteobacteria bacterium RBG_16_71_12]|nr:MAG: hypothetical protein A2138_12660 [Deltaproteobacteria bacterium RBG_16_71_12]